MEALWKMNQTLFDEDVWKRTDSSPELGSRLIIILFTFNGVLFLIMGFGFAYVLWKKRRVRIIKKELLFGDKWDDHPSNGGKAPLPSQMQAPKSSGQGKTLHGGPAARRLPSPERDPDAEDNLQWNVINLSQTSASESKTEILEKRCEDLNDNFKLPSIQNNLLKKTHARFFRTNPSQLSPIPELTPSVKEADQSSTCGGYIPSLLDMKQESDVIIGSGGDVMRSHKSENSETSLRISPQGDNSPPQGWEAVDVDNLPGMRMGGKTSDIDPDIEPSKIMTFFTPGPDDKGVFIDFQSHANAPPTSIELDINSQLYCAQSKAFDFN